MITHSTQKSFIHSHLEQYTYKHTCNPHISFHCACVFSNLCVILLGWLRWYRPRNKSKKRIPAQFHREQRSFQRQHIWNNATFHCVTQQACLSEPHHWRSGKDCRLEGQMISWAGVTCCDRWLLELSHTDTGYELKVRGEKQEKKKRGLRKRNRRLICFYYFPNFPGLVIG